MGTLREGVGCEETGSSGETILGRTIALCPLDGEESANTDEDGGGCEDDGAEFLLAFDRHDVILPYLVDYGFCCGVV